MIPRVGELFRHFRVLEKAGEGGMDIVFRAHDERLQRDVALKFLTRVGHLLPERAARLRAEAKSLAALNHPNVVTIYDLDELEGVPFLVLEWLSGGTLNGPGHPRPFTLKRLFEVALPIAEALSAAHKRGIVHRDVKPGNVLFSSDSIAKLADFGLAKFRESPKLTETASLQGTYAYMSPEQALSAEAGPESDVFSFGVMLYALLTGQLPFQAEHPAAVMYAIIHTPHVPLASLRKDLPERLERLLERCLEKNRRDRFESGTSLAEELRLVYREYSLPHATGHEPTAISIPLRSEVLKSQEIRFCETSDGARVAYSMLGSGRILVRVLGWFTHLEMEWDWPEMRTFWQDLAAMYTVVRYDGRGIGLSDPYAGPFTEETRRLDLEAVLQAVGAEKAALLGISEGGWTAARFAVASPERTSHLILYGAYSRGACVRPGFDAEEERALTTLVRKGWGRDTPAFRQIFTSQFFPGDVDLRVTSHFDEMQRTSADPDTAARYMESCHSRLDGGDFFARVKVPTLVIHCRDDRVVNFEEGRLLAAIIPGAQFLPLGSGTHYFPSNQQVSTKIVQAIVRLTGDQVT